MQLNEKQQYADRKVMSGKNLYIGGPGGVGKSVLIRHICEHYGQGTVLLAPTGIAALNISASTIHSAFRLPHSMITERDHSHINQKTHDLFATDGPVKRIIVDEVSMVRGDVFHAIDQQLRRIRRLKHQPFGGLQVIVVGDFYQLPPVLTNREKKAYYAAYNSPYAFGDSTWAAAGFEYIELDEIMRQSDTTFISHLQRIRTRADGFRQSIEFFNDTAQSNSGHINEDDPTYICATNATVDMINSDRFEELKGEDEKTFHASKWGKVDAEPSPQELVLRYGTKVIVTANTDVALNGETGYVIGFVGDKVRVLKESDESEITISRYTWEQIELTNIDGQVQRNVVGSYKQLPLKHGWAVTIHKCQGLTLPNGIMDLGRGAFCHGQTYVGLSRIKSLDGIGLITPIRHQDIIVDSAVREFYDNDCKGIGLF